MRGAAIPRPLRAFSFQQTVNQSGGKGIASADSIAITGQAYNVDAGTIMW